MDANNTSIVWVRKRKPISIETNMSRKFMRIEFYSSKQKPNESVVDFLIGKIANFKKLYKKSKEPLLLKTIQRLLLPPNSSWIVESQISNVKDLLFEALSRERFLSKPDASWFKPVCSYCTGSHFCDTCPVIYNNEVMKIGEITSNSINEDVLYIPMKMNDILHLAVIGIKTTHTFVKEGLIRISCPDSVLEYRVIDSTNCHMFATGPLTAVFDVNNFQIANPVYEVANMKVDIILGCDWLINVGAVIDFENKCIHFNDWNGIKLDFLDMNK